MRSCAPPDWTATPTVKPRVTPEPGWNRLSQIRAIGIALSVTNHAETWGSDSVDNYTWVSRLPRWLQDLKIGAYLSHASLSFGLTSAITRE